MGTWIASGPRTPVKRDRRSQLGGYDVKRIPSSTDLPNTSTAGQR